MEPSTKKPAIPRVAIVGGGFGGLEVARRLRKAKVDVTLVDRRNYHLFQPLLYQVATGGLSPANIAAPLRGILNRQRNCQVVLGDVTDVDLIRHRLVLEDGTIPFDYVVFAAGATHSYFGNPEWAQNAPGLKTITEATSIRRRLYIAFEAAERTHDPAVRRQLMTFVIVGAGPTGVEMAGALAEIARYTLKHDFRRIDPEDAHIILAEAGEHVLSTYPTSLCEWAEAKIRSLGIEVLTNTMVTDITKDHVRLKTGDTERLVPTRTVLWAAGVKANPLGKKLADACEAETDRGGRVIVTPGLNVPGYEEVFVIGDLAHCKDEAGTPLPGVAPVAIQQGRYVARLIAKRVGGDLNPVPPFRYRNLGMMATIGRAAAVAHIGRFRTSGFVAWIMWLFVHLMQIVQFQNRLLILMQWSWNYATFNRSARIITGDDERVIVRPEHDTPEDSLDPYGRLLETPDSSTPKV